MESDVKENSESNVNTPEASEMVPPEVIPPEPPSETIPPEAPSETILPDPPSETIPSEPPSEMKPPEPPSETIPPEPPSETIPPEPPSEILPPKPPSEVIPPESPEGEVKLEFKGISPEPDMVLPETEALPSGVSVVAVSEEHAQKDEENSTENESKDLSNPTENQSKSIESRSNITENPTSTEKTYAPIDDGTSSTKKPDIAINGLVVKVHLNRCNFDDILSKEEEPVSKEKVERAGESKAVTKPPEVRQHGEKRKIFITVGSPAPAKRKRGRPPKKIKPEEEVDASGESEAESVAPVQQQQPKLVRKRGRPRKIRVEKSGSDTESRPPAKRFNGDKVSTSRIIKPNSRLQDFVVSSSVRYYAQSAIKSRQAKSENVTEDVAKPTVSAGKKEGVRSFLPAFDGSGYSDDTDDEVKEVKAWKEKENQVDNIPMKRRAKVEDIDYSPKPTPKVAVRPRILATRTQRPIGNLQSKLNGSSVKQFKTNVRGTLVAYKKTNDIDFDELVRSLKLVKLPGPNWKIRIVVSKQQTITEVTFTNKEAFERCVKFSRTVPGHSITFGKSIARLLGSPPEVATHDDVTVLLDIVHSLAVDDPVLEYNTRSV